MKTHLRAKALACALLAGTAYCGLAAQPAAAQASAAPAHRALDANGVDLTHGGFHLNFLEGSIGSGEAELALFRRNGGRSQWEGIELERATSGSSATIWIKIGMDSEKFTGTPTSLTPAEANGGTLTPGGGGYVYTARDGTTITFFDPTNHQYGGETNLCHSNGPQASCRLIPDSIASPDGRSVSFTWGVAQRCASEFNEDSTLDCQFFWRLDRVSNSFGQRLDFSYAAADGGGTLGQVPAADWSKRTRSDFLNTVVSASPQAAVTYAYPSAGVTDVTDMAGRIWRFTADPVTGDFTALRRPGAASDTTTLAYGPGTLTLTRDGVTTQYSRSVSGSIATMTVTQVVPGGASPVSTVVSDLAVGRPTSITDPLGRTTEYQYDGNGRLTRITFPEDNYVELQLDSRGNVTETRRVAKPGSGLPPIVGSATYASSCFADPACNRPLTATDARGNVTDYSYDPTHGGVLRATGPAIGGIRPQTRYSYTLTNGEYRLTGISQCRTGQAELNGVPAACIGTADEVKTAIAYNADGTVASAGTGDGTGALTASRAMTYDAMGDLLTVDGPLAGPADTVRYRYNAARELVGSVSPDPDGAGPLKPRAVRNTLDGSTGLLAKVEQGNVDSQSDSDWAAFAPAQAVETSYDVNARPVATRLVSGSTVHALTQTKYDALGRPECVAQRMDLADFASSLPDACTLTAPAGAEGPDRIAKSIYDAAGRVTQVKTALGTADEANEVTATHTDSGLVQTVTDGENNKTTYEYDGHDRLRNTRYPLPTKGANASAPTSGPTADYEQSTYESLAGGTRTSDLAVSFRNRAGESIGFSYDALGRLSSKDRPGAEPDVAYGYDLLGQMTSASQPGHVLGFTYDSLGRLLTQTGPLGTMTSEYDLAGRRTRLTWPDSFYVTYDHLVTGETTKIRENGAASGLGVLASFTYDQLGRRTGLVRGNGTVTGYAFDPVSRLQQLTLDAGGTASDLTLGFTYNPASQIASTTRSNDLYAWTGHGSGTTTNTANGLNQIESPAGTLTYDAKGNIVTNGSYTFAYSSENLLTSLTNPLGTLQTSSTYAYDPLMRLAVIDSSNPGFDAQFGYDGQEIVIEGLSNGRTRRYVHGPGVDEPLVAYLVTGTGTSRSWYLADERGSIVRQTNDVGNPGSSAGTYDEYGVGPGTSRFQYTGQYWLGDSNLHYYRARIYDPKLGRFLQPDPIGYGGGMNRYAYVGGDPVNFIDPSGLCRFTLWGTFRHSSDWSTWELLDTFVTQDSACGSGWMPTDYFSAAFGVGDGGGGGGGGGWGRDDKRKSGSKGCPASGANDKARLNALASVVGPVRFNSKNEQALLAQYFRGDTTPYRLSAAEMAQANNYVSTYGNSVMGRPSVRPDGLTERSIFFGKFSSDAPLLDGLLGIATGIFAGKELVGIRDTFNFDFKDRGYPGGVLANVGVGLVRLDAATCAGNVGIPVSGGVK